MKNHTLRPSYAARTAAALAVLAGLAATTAVHASKLPESEVMAKQAVAYVKAMGAEAAYSAFNNGLAFNSHDSWVAVIGADGKLLALSNSPTRVGQNVHLSSDANGIELARMFSDSLRSDAGHTTVYLAVDPSTSLPRNASVHIERVGNAYLALGVYMDTADISEGW